MGYKHIQTKVLKALQGGAWYFGMSGIEIGYAVNAHRDMGDLYKPVGSSDDNAEYHVRSGKWLSERGGTISVQGYNYWALITNIGRKAPTGANFIYYQEGSGTWSAQVWLSTSGGRREYEEQVYCVLGGTTNQDGRVHDASARPNLSLNARPLRLSISKNK